MKTVAYRNMILAAAALAISVTPAVAQGSTTKLKAEVPFSFRVGGMEYPAGTYETSVITMSSGARVVKVLNLRSGDPACLRYFRINGRT